jgi:hypothetical protein
MINLQNKIIKKYNKDNHFLHYSDGKELIYKIKIIPQKIPHMIEGKKIHSVSKN